MLAAARRLPGGGPAVQVEMETPAFAFARAGATPW